MFLLNRLDNELDRENLRLPSYCIPVVYILSHQLFGRIVDETNQDR